MLGGFPGRLVEVLASPDGVTQDAPQALVVERQDFVRHGHRGHRRPRFRTLQDVLAQVPELLLARDLVLDIAQDEHVGGLLRDEVHHLAVARHERPGRVVNHL